MKQTFKAKFLSVILSLCILLCMVPMMGITASALDVTYDTDGTTILISTPAQLAAIGVDANYPRDGAYKLANDIDLSGFDTDSDEANGNWTPLCANFSKAYNYAFNENVAFAGSLDGQGYTISGMNIIDTVNSTAHLGLFAHVTAGANISNIVFKNCSITAELGVSCYAGFVVGYCDKGEKIISNIAVLDSSIDVETRNALNGSGIGSIAGSATYAKISNVYSEASLTGNCTIDGNYQFGIAGIAGAAWRGIVTIDGAVFNGTIQNTVPNADYYFKNGIFALNAAHVVETGTAYPTNAGKFTNCWYNSDKLEVLETATAEISGTDGGHINGTALTSAELLEKELSELGFSADYWCVETGIPVLRITLADTVPYYDGYIPIYDAWDLAKIGKDEAYPLSGSYMVMNDIDMSDYGAWTPIAYSTTSSIGSATAKAAAFTGVFNGGGHTISNLELSISGSDIYTGLFGFAYDAEFSNIVFRNAKLETTVTSKGFSGVLLGVSISSSSSQPYLTTVTNVAVYDSSVKVTTSQPANQTAAGGIVGTSESGVSFFDCYAETDVSAYYSSDTAGEAYQNAVGGFLGSAYAGKITAEDSIFAGTINSVYYTEGYEANTEYLRQNSILGANSAAISPTSGSYSNNNKVGNAKQTNCYYLDTVKVNTANPRGLDGTAISADALKTATAETMGFNALYWKNDGKGLYLAVASNINEDGVIEIDTAEELAAIGVSSQYPRTGHYILTADIDLSGWGNWTPICPAANAAQQDKAAGFAGVFDGQGHTISGMNITQSQTYSVVGFFGMIHGCEAIGKTRICNIVFKNCTVDVTGSKNVYAGILVGYLDNTDYKWVSVDNIAIIDSSVNGVANAANTCGIGSIAGSATGLQMTNIYSNAELSGGCTVANDSFGMGGLTGYSWFGRSWSKSAVFNGTITNNNNTDSTYTYTAGMLGYNNKHTDTSPTPVDGNEYSYYNSDKLTVSTTTNGSEYNGTALSSYDLGITTVGIKGLDTAYWMHNGTTPILKIVGDKEYVSGDANGDTKCDLLDLIRAKKYIASSANTMQLVAADLNRDLKINATDLTYISRIVMGVGNATTVMLADAAEQVKYLGMANSENNVLAMNWSNTGYEFSAMAEGDITSTIKFVSTGNNDWPYARLAVTVNGETNIINVTEGTNIYTLASDLEYGVYNVQVLKITERSKGSVYATDISFVGALNERPADKELTIDFYGDSITAGDGVVKNDHITQEDKLECQYSNKTYAAKTAEALNADIRVAAKSGLKTVDAVNNLILANWDYEKNPADVVVINLGTNDKEVIYAGTQENEDGSTTAIVTDDGIAAEKTAIVAMLDAVREKYGAETKIVWCYGSMGTPLVDYIKPVVEEYAASNANVYYCELPANNAGCKGHPTEEGHAEAAEVLTEFINGIIK